ncbi:MAG TPA: protein kinase [Thermoanaerobaculia bacterium]|nr:protein kinase [Thermoanaerobaculia bacterium]
MVAVGTRLGPFEIVAPVGAGGMGEVWRAHDTRLRRDVAVKVLPESLSARPAALARFEREARSVAALSHPNVVAIHDFGNAEGTVYIVMELLEGATLRQRLAEAAVPIARALDWGYQIAQGLSAAHERGVIHRDLKPDNIFVTRDGVLKILDFGLARLEAEESADANSATLAQTTPGTVLGTVGYLSPEQARGEPADHRSDIFAFGVVLYEVIAGRPAFARSTAADSLVAILSEEPTPLAELGRFVPPEVEEILAHCLEKNRDERFRSARDLAFALRMATRAASVASAETAVRPTPRPAEARRTVTENSLAVLPFRNIGPTAETEYFTDGMTEEIINSISNIPTLHVAARTSSFAFKGREDDVRKVGRELGVAMVLEGSVRQVGSRLRVTAQLINVETGYQVWSERWDRDLADVFAVQDEIAQAIASTFKLRLAEREGTGPAGRTQNVEAYDRYLKGRYLLTLRRAPQAIAEFECAIDADPDFVDAHTALADGWAIRGFYGGIPTWEAWARASAAVDEAERIDPDAAGIPLSRAILQHYYGWNTAREEVLCREAIERNPKSAEGWNWLGLCHGLSGRTKEALEETRRATELEPFNANPRASAAFGLIIAGDYENAERAASKALEFDPKAAYPLWTRGIALRFLGRHSESIAIFEQLVEASERRLSFYIGLLGGALGDAGERARAEECVHDLLARRERGEFVASTEVASVLTALGEDERAVEALERGREERNALMWSRIYFPDLIRLRFHPRWQALARRLSRAAPMSPSLLPPDDRSPSG